MRRTKEKPKLDVYIPEDSTVSADGFKNLSVGDKVMVMVFGDVSSVSENRDEWDRGKRMSVIIQKCRIENPATKTTITDAIKAVAKTV